MLSLAFRFDFAPRSRNPVRLSHHSTALSCSRAGFVAR